jgi:hypothetical protein
MPMLTINYDTDAERLLLEQAIAYLTHLRQVATTAPCGEVLAACEQAALTEGRQLLRDTLAGAAQARITADEQKGGPLECARGVRPRADTRAGIRGPF